VNLVSSAIATYVTIQIDNQIVCQTVPASSRDVSYAGRGMKTMRNLSRRNKNEPATFIAGPQGRDGNG